MGPLKFNDVYLETNKVLQNISSFLKVSNNLEEARNNLNNKDLKQARNHLNRMRGIDLQAALRLEINTCKLQRGTERVKQLIANVKNPKLQQLAKLYLEKIEQSSVSSSTGSSSSVSSNPNNPGFGKARTTDFMAKENLPLFFDSSNPPNNSSEPVSLFKNMRDVNETSQAGPFFDLLSQDDLRNALDYMSGLPSDSLDLKQARSIYDQKCKLFIENELSSISIEEAQFFAINIQTDSIRSEMENLIQKEKEKRKQVDQEIISALKSLIDNDETIDNFYLQSVMEKLTPEGKLKARELLDASSHIVAFSIEDEPKGTLEIGGQIYSVDSIEDLLIENKNSLPSLAEVEVLGLIEESLSSGDFDEAFAIAMSIQNESHKNKAFLKLIKYQAHQLNLEEISNLTQHMTDGQEKNEAIHLVSSLIESMYGD